jgi:hypothetical protein
MQYLSNSQLSKLLRSILGPQEDLSGSLVLEVVRTVKKGLDFTIETSSKRVGISKNKVRHSIERGLKCNRWTFERH